MDSFPMIERCMLRQSEFFSFYACLTCSHEVERRDDSTYDYDCNWCGVEHIHPVWLEPKMVDGKVVVEKCQFQVVTV